jgi:WD40 repeat protein
MQTTITKDKLKTLTPRTIDVKGRVTSLCYFPDGGINTILVGKIDGEVEAWDLNSSSLIRKFDEHSYGVKCIIPANNISEGFFLSSGGDYKIRLWSFDDTSSVKVVAESSHVFNVMTFVKSYNDVLVTGNSEKVYVYDVSGDGLLATLEGHSSTVTSITEIQDQGIVATGDSSGTVILWDLKSNSMISKFGDHTKNITNLFYLDKLLICSDYNQIKLWNFENKTAKKSINPGHKESINYVALIGNGDFLATCSDDKIVKFIDMKTGFSIKSFENKQISSSICDTSSSGKSVVVTGDSNDSKSIIVYELS